MIKFGDVLSAVYVYMKSNNILNSGDIMKEYTVEEVVKLTKKVNENRSKLYSCMKHWKKKPPLTEFDVRMVLAADSA